MNGRKAKRIRALLGKEIAASASYQASNQKSVPVMGHGGTMVGIKQTCTISLANSGRKSYKVLKKLAKRG